LLSATTQSPWIVGGIGAYQPLRNGTTPAAGVMPVYSLEQVRPAFLRLSPSLDGFAVGFSGHETGQRSYNADCSGFFWRQGYHHHRTVLAPFPLSSCSRAPWPLALEAPLRAESPAPSLADGLDEPRSKPPVPNCSALASCPQRPVWSASAGSQLHARVSTPFSGRSRLAQHVLKPRIDTVGVGAAAAGAGLLGAARHRATSRDPISDAPPHSPARPEPLSCRPGAD